MQLHKTNHSDPRIKPVATGGVSGSGMDRKVAVSPVRKYNKLLWIAGAIVVLVLAYGLMEKSAGNSLSVDTSRIAISQVTSGVFDDFLPVRGRVTPAKTVFLDAVEGGRVERILVEDGADLQAGDLIVELSNASLQLNVLGNEARVAEQLNNIRSIELNLEQNRLSHKRNLIDINYQIKLLTRQVERQRDLLRTGAINQTQFEDTQDELNWYKQRRDITLESQASDARMQEEQLAYLKETGQRLESNLALSRKNLDSMNVKAPVNGRLSGFNIEIGQSIGRGERIGQIDTPDDFKVTAFLDEFYLGRIQIGQSARYDEFELQVSKIYPQVTNGQFQIDLEFNQSQPVAIRRGQTVQLRLTLSDATNALLIPNGSFYQDTGGNWLFVVEADGNAAYRRNVRLGRRNSQFIEVLEGLEQGEKVITSPYSSYQDFDVLILK